MKQKSLLKLTYLKGQIKSEWIYEIINFPKNDRKKWISALCTVQTPRAEILQIFWVSFWKLMIS